MTKLLVVQGEDHYLIDLDKTKAKPLHEVLAAVGADELLIARTDELELTTLTGLLSSALSARSAPAAPPKATRTPTTKAEPRKDLDDIRAWGRAKGYEISDHGRIKQAYIDEYDAEHK